jgi:WD40 repeat protein
MRKSLLSHKGRCFDARFSYDGSSLLSASEDGSAVLWNLKLHKSACVLNHNKDSEVLRSCFVSSRIICTAGADGQAYLWLSASDESTKDKPKYRKGAILPHGDTQIYSCEAISDRVIITAAENCLFVWDIESCSSCSHDSELPHLEPVSSWSFDTAAPTSGDSGVPFGGPRNPDNTCYIFDAKVGTHSSVFTLSFGRRVDLTRIKILCYITIQFYLILTEMIIE